LTTSVLAAVLSTGSLNLATASGSPSFAGTASVKSTTKSTTPVHVKAGTCMAEGDSVLAVDMSGSTGDVVQLVGSLVAQPTSATTGDTYLFRGNVTQTAGTAAAQDGLPWGLPSAFVAQVQVQSRTSTAALTVVFMRPENGVAVDPTTPSTVTTPESAASGDPGAAVAPAGSTTSTETPLSWPGKTLY
ncbi:MAG: hypothetical protein ACRD6W_05035, partial [Nitrososphaerales archaeon]